MNEDAPSVGPSARVARRVPGGIRYVTPEGHLRLLEELEALRAALASSPPHGPGAEDAAARADLEARLAVKLETLEAIQVVPPKASGKAFFGAWVELEDEDGGSATWRIVGPDEADAKLGAVSVDSPMGRALLGKEPGDEIAVQRPAGVRTYSILSVRYR